MIGETGKYGFTTMVFGREIGVLAGTDNGASGAGIGKFDLVRKATTTNVGLVVKSDISPGNVMQKTSLAGRGFTTLPGFISSSEF